MWASRIERGFLHITTVTILEAGYSARSAEDLGRILNGPPISSMSVEYLTPAIEDRAVQVSRRWRSGVSIGHRPLPDIWSPPPRSGPG